MAVAETQAWHEIVLQALKRNDIKLVPYVPDRVLTTLIKNIHADPFFTTFPTAREEEAVGTSVPSAAIASSNFRRWPIEVTPRPIKSSAVKLGNTLSSISFARKARTSAASLRCPSFSSPPRGSRCPEVGPLK